MRASWLRGLAAGAATAALVVVPATGVMAAPDVDRRDATVGMATATDGTAPAVAPWVPGAMSRAARAAAVPGERYTAIAERWTVERRADALALAHAAMRAAGSAHDVGESVEPSVLQDLGSGVVLLAELVDGAGFTGVQVRTAPGALRIPDADVAPADVRPDRDLVLAASIEDAAAEVFRLSIQVEVAAREDGPGDPIGGPGDLRAPAALTPVADETVADETADGGAVPVGDDDAESAGPAGQEPEGVATPGGQAEPEVRDGAGGVDAGSADRGAGTGSADDDATTGSEGTGGAEGAGGPTDAEGPTNAEGPTGTEGDGATGGPGAADVVDRESAETVEPASLDALPADLVAGLEALENAVTAAGELLAADILGLESVPFLTAGRARLMALEQGLDAGDVAAWSRWTNGRIPPAELCEVEFAPGSLLRCDAAYALELLNVEYRAEFGEDVGIVSAYRSYDAQVRIKASHGWLAATPGMSNHGWGIAVDLSGMGGLGDYSSPRYRWMVEHGPAFGWHHPESMRPGGNGPPEPWHFEFGTAPGERAGADGGAVADPR